MAAPRQRTGCLLDGRSYPERRRPSGTFGSSSCPSGWRRRARDRGRPARPPGLAVLDSARAGRRSRWTYITADPLAVMTDIGPRGATFAPARALLARMEGRRAAPAAAWGRAGTSPVHRGARRLSVRRGPRAGAHPVDRPRRPAAPTPLPRAPRVGGRGGAPGGPRAAAAGPSTGMPAGSMRGSRRSGRDSRGCERRGRTSAAHGRRGRVCARTASRLPASGSPPASVATRGATASGGSGRRSPPARSTRRTSRAAWRRRSPATRGRSSSAPGRRPGHLRGVPRPRPGPGGRRPGPGGGRRAAGDRLCVAGAVPLGRRGRARGDRPDQGDTSARPDPRRGPRARRRAPRERQGPAENVMIVDVLRNDLGRVCRPGRVRVPRLCRLERTEAVQHLVSTVVGRLAPGRDAFDLLAAAFPGGSITGAPKIRAMRLIEELSRSGAAPTAAPPSGWDRTARWDRASSSGRSSPTASPHAARRRRHHAPERPGRRMGGDPGQGPWPAAGDRGEEA